MCFQGWLLPGPKINTGARNGAFHLNVNVSIIALPTGDVKGQNDDKAFEPRGASLTIPCMYGLAIHGGCPWYGFTQSLRTTMGRSPACDKGRLLRLHGTILTETETLMRVISSNDMDLCCQFNSMWYVFDCKLAIMIHDGWVHLWY